MRDQNFQSFGQFEFECQIKLSIFLIKLQIYYYLSKEPGATTKGLTNNGDQNGITAPGVDDDDIANEKNKTNNENYEITNKQEPETLPKRSNVAESNNFNAGADFAKSSKVDDENKASDKEMVSFTTIINSIVSLWTIKTFSRKFGTLPIL